MKVLVDASVEGRRSLAEVEAGVGHVLRDAVGHDREVLDFAARECRERQSLRLESCRARETKAAVEKKRQGRVDESKYK